MELFILAWLLCGVRGCFVLYKNGGKERMEVFYMAVPKTFAVIAALVCVLAAGPFTLITTRPLRIFSVVLGVALAAFLLQYVALLGWWYVPIAFYLMSIPTAIPA